MPTKIWGIHTTDDRLFLDSNLIAIGWKSMGNLSLLPNSREAFKEKYEQIYPNCKKGAIATSAGMLYRFMYEVSVGDFIVYPSRIDRQINLGIVDGQYYYDQSAHEYCSRRKVRWLKNLPRTSFSQGALHEVGSALTFFMVKNYSTEFFDALDIDFKPISEERDKETINVTAQEIIESTKDFILKELSRNLKGYDLEGFVANLLNAMGYRTILSKHGGDSGIDITAYKDELPPRILVQVKSQDGDIKESTIQSLKGAMHEGDYGLFVTLSNYTRNAKRYLENTPIIRGINGMELVELVLKYYELLDEKYRKMIPLKMVYIPVAVEDEFMEK